MAPMTTLPTLAASPTSGAGAAGGVSHGERRGLRCGFTLVEMLVIIGIIVLILGLAAPMITRAWRAGDRAATYADLQAIATALEAYRQDHGEYPQVRYDPSIPPTPITNDRPNPPTGAQVLCQALIAPAPATNSGAAGRKVQDGADGPGFRTRGTQGRVYGPYLQPGKFKVADPANPNAPPAPNKELVLTIMDRSNSRPILYFPAAAGKPNIRVNTGGVPGFVHSDPTPTGVLSELSLYDADDNLDYFKRPPNDNNATTALTRIRLMLGDLPPNQTPPAEPSKWSGAPNGMIDGAESAATTSPFILWAAGPDDQFGPNATTAPESGTLNQADAAVCDDVTNFRQ